jgi:hypothetical protein
MLMQVLMERMPNCVKTQESIRETYLFKSYFGCYVLEVQVSLCTVAVYSISIGGSLDMCDISCTLYKLASLWVIEKNQSYR